MRNDSSPTPDTSALREDAQAQGRPGPRPDPRPVAPEPPLPSDCCDSGCDPCVNDTYAEELQDYRERLAKWLERHPDAG